MDASIFMEKAVIPDEASLKSGIGKSYELWKLLFDFTFQKYPKARAEWNFPGKKYGWSFRIKDKKRAIIYLLPRDEYFKVAFVFGQKATNAILASNMNEEIKMKLTTAKVYAEGRGINIDVTGFEILNDIKKLIEFKLAH